MRRNANHPVANTIPLAPTNTATNPTNGNANIIMANCYPHHANPNHSAGGNEI